jgi:hypothetical protein
MRFRTEIGSLYAYEIDDDSSVYWDIFTEDVHPDTYNPVYLTTVEVDDFGDYLDTVRGLGYDLFINTYSSWLKEIDNEFSDVPSV